MFAAGLSAATPLRYVSCQQEAPDRSDLESLKKQMPPRISVEEMRGIASDPKTRALFLSAGVQTVDEIVQRSVQVQDLALQGDAKRPYFCVLRGSFLLPRITGHPFYQIITQYDLDRRRILDIGCCMGTDVRQLLLDGASKELTRGIDYSNDFIQLGFELFGDAEQLDGVFQRVDILEDSPSSWASDHADEFDVVHCGAVLHTFDSREEVQEVLRRVYTVIRPGGVFFGSNRPTWVHNASSLRAELEHLGFEGVHVFEGARHKDRAQMPGGEAQQIWTAGYEKAGPGTFFIAYKPRE